MHESAFPTPEFFDDKLIACFPGMTKRELFAALAMMGLLAADSMIDGDMVRDSVFAADLLIQQLSQSKSAQ